MTIKNINLNPVSLLILFFTITFVLITTPFYDLEATLIFGGKDGIDYFKISFRGFLLQLSNLFGFTSVKNSIHHDLYFWTWLKF